MTRAPGAKGLSVIAAVWASIASGSTHAQGAAASPDAAAPPASEAPAPAAPPPPPAAPPTAPSPAPPPPPPGYGYPPPGYGYPPPGYGYPPPGYGYPPPGYAYSPPRAYAYPPVVPVFGSHTHDGFYLRLHLGPDYTAMSSGPAAVIGGSSMEVSGPGVGFGVAVGGALTTDFVLYGTMVISSASNPTVKIDGMSLGSGSGDMDLVGLGGGAAYYIEPTNLYVAGSILLANLQITDSNGKKIGESDSGLGLEGLVGKEWWVSDQWGLGVAAQVLWARMKDKDTFGMGNPPTLNAHAFSLLFSATYN
jgi:hypothetical protein